MKVDLAGKSLREREALRRRVDDVMARKKREGAMSQSRRRINRDLTILTPEEREHLQRQRAKRGEPANRFNFYPGELCRVARRREGLSQRAVADLMRPPVSHVTMIKRERGRGDEEALVAFWARRRFRFPPGTPGARR